MNRKTIILDGNKYNFLTVISFSHSDKRGRKWYNVKCDCGKEKSVMGSAMTSNNTKSCGCIGPKLRSEKFLLPNNIAVKRQILLQYKRHAQDRGFDFLLNEEEFFPLIEKKCFYCNLPPSNLKKTKNFKEGFLYSGVDRVDSSIGYTKDNCVPCCGQCNKAKLAFSKEEFLSWVKRVYEHSVAGI